MPGKLSTHVLDLSAGKPAGGMKIRLLALNADPVLLKDTRTNQDGRTEAPLLALGELKAGAYRLQFFVREYFSAQGIECPFLEVVSVDFHVADASASYHVPLLVTPWSYSTYRGS